MKINFHFFHFFQFESQISQLFSIDVGKNFFYTKLINLKLVNETFCIVSFNFGVNRFFFFNVFSTLTASLAIFFYLM